MRYFAFPIIVASVYCPLSMVFAWHYCLFDRPTLHGLPFTLVTAVLIFDCRTHCLAVGGFWSILCERTVGLDSVIYLYFVLWPRFPFHILYTLFSLIPTYLFTFYGSLIRHYYLQFCLFMIWPSRAVTPPLLHNYCFDSLPPFFYLYILAHILYICII